MPGSDSIGLIFSKRKFYRVYAVLALLSRLLVRLIAWVLEGGGYLATPTIPVCVTNAHRSTTAEAALHGAVPGNRGVRPSNTSTDTATMGVGTSNHKKHVEASEQFSKCTWLQANNSQSTHSVSDQSDGRDACTAESSSLSVQFYQYHVVYLPSYSVPVLLFQAHNEDGSQLKREDIVANLPEAYRRCAHQPDAAWSFISQVEHPHLGSPWHMLHPCQTDELMSLMLSPDETTSAAQDSINAASSLQYMTAWFSLVAPPLCLQLDATLV